MLPVVPQGTMAQLRITVLEEPSLLPPPIELCSYGSQKWVVATLPWLSRGLGDSDTLLYRTFDPQSRAAFVSHFHLQAHVRCWQGNSCDRLSLSPQGA